MKPIPAKPFALFLLAAIPLLLPSLPVRAQDEPLPDPRLAQKVTYTATAAPLETVGDTLSQKTGIVIRVGAGERDWRTKERKVHLVLKDLPVGTALYELSKTLGYDFRRTGDEGKWAYRIWQSTRQRDYETAMLTQENEEREKEIQHVREGVLDDADAVAQMSPEDAMKLKDSDPWKAYLGGTDAGRAYASLMRGLPQDTRELMLRGQRVTLDASDLPQNLQGTLQQMVTGSFFAHMQNPNQQNDFNNLLKTTKPSRVVFMPIPESMGGDVAGSLGVSGMAIVMGDPDGAKPEMQAMMDQMDNQGMGRGLPMAMMPLTGANSPGGKLFGQMMFRLDAGEDPQQVMQQMGQQMESGGILSDMANTNVTPTPTPTDPALLQEIEPIPLKVSMTQVQSQSGELVKQLAKQTSLSIIWEFYPEQVPLSLVLPSKKAPLYQYLDKLQQAGFDWRYEKGVVCIRPKRWAQERSYDVPQSLIAGYRNILEAKGWFDLDSLGSIAVNMTDGQITHRLLQDPGLVYASTALVSLQSNGNDMLRFYGQLAPEQKARIKTEQGLPFDSLTEPQWGTLSRVVEEATGGAEIKPGTIRLSVEDINLPAPPPAPAANPGNPKIGAAPAKPAAKAQKASPVKTQAAKPATGSETPKETPPDKNAPPAPPQGPLMQKADFTVKMESDQPDKPLEFKKSLSIPAKAQIQMIKQAMDQMQKRFEKKPDDAAAPKPGDKSAPKSEDKAPADSAVTGAKTK